MSTEDPPRPGSPLPIPPAVVLQAGVRPLWVATGGCGRGLGPMDPVGRLQPDVRWRRVLLQPSLRQPQVSLQAPLQGELAGRGCAPYSYPISLLSSTLSRPTIGGKYCLGERRRHRSCNTDVSFCGTSSPVLRGKGINQFTRSGSRLRTASLFPTQPHVPHPCPAPRTNPGVWRPPILAVDESPTLKYFFDLHHPLLLQCAPPSPFIAWFLQRTPLLPQSCH